MPRRLGYLDAAGRRCAARWSGGFHGIATTLGLLAEAVVLCSLIVMGGHLRMFLDTHAAIVIFGGSFAATLIRFPLSSIMHGIPIGAKYAFTLRCAKSPRYPRLHALRVSTGLHFRRISPWCPEKAGDIRPDLFCRGEIHSLHEEDPRNAAAAGGGGRNS